MVHFCAVFGCGNKARKPGLAFFRFPAVNSRVNYATQDLQRKRRNAWVAAIRRKDLNVEKLENARVCSNHFMSGKPADLYQENSPDWAPCLNLGYGTSATEKSLQRFQRTDNRQKQILAQNTAPAEFSLPETDIFVPESGVSSQTDQIPVESVGTQTELAASNVKAIQDDLVFANQEIYRLRKKLCNMELSQGCFENNDTKVNFYTGLQSFAVLMMLLLDISPFIKFTVTSSLTKFQQLLLTLMKLRLNLQFNDLGYRFGISSTTSSRVFHQTLTVLYKRLTHMILWPEREQLRQTMPSCFRETFGSSVAIIIDCFEIFIERPSNLKARAQTWSNYKHRNTMKYLIGICPQGAISFISEGWGGRASDKLITEESGLLCKLLPGDTVLADRGFNITDEAAMYLAEVKIPAFTKGKNQLHPLDVEKTRNIASVRIHVERVIGTIRQKYQILSGPVPIEMLMRNHDDCTVDKIVRVCCSLCNMCPSVIPNT